MLKDFPVQSDPNLLVGHSGADDAGVYRIDDERALVLTVDFFTPIVDDPYDYGRVAAANSLSDVYAMGGRPIAALNIAAFPEGELPPAVLGQILNGGAATAKEAGIVIAGGHTVKDKELKYGLSVVGLIHPGKIMENAGAKPGDALILTKPLGTGIVTTALKMEQLADEHYAPLIASMTQLNRHAADQMEAFGVHACTDITGNGLLGHALEMAKGSNATLEIEAAELPVLPGVIDYIRRDLLTGGDHTNRLFIEPHFEWRRERDETLEHLMLDPQTSGGLLMAVPDENAGGLLAKLKGECRNAAIVGRVVAKSGGVYLRII